MVTYSSGGTTPGDSYLWKLNDDYTPKAWKMWVKIIPVDGIEISWEQWENFPNGIRIATAHDGLFSLKLENAVVSQSIKELNNGADPFVDFKLQVEKLFCSP